MRKSISRNEVGVKKGTASPVVGVMLTYSIPFREGLLEKVTKPS